MKKFISGIKERLTRKKREHDELVKRLSRMEEAIEKTQVEIYGMMRNLSSSNEEWHHGKLIGLKQVLEIMDKNLGEVDL